MFRYRPAHLRSNLTNRGTIGQSHRKSTGGNDAPHRLYPAATFPVDVEPQVQTTLHPRSIAQRIGIQEGISIAGGQPMTRLTGTAFQETLLPRPACHDAPRHHKRAEQHTIRGVAQTRGNHPAVTGTHCAGGYLYGKRDIYLSTRTLHSDSSKGHSSGRPRRTGRRHAGTQGKGRQATG